MPKKDQIFENIYGNVKLEELQLENGGKKYVISGPFTMADRPNLNNRIYPKAVMNEAIGKFREKVQRKQIKMCMDHPDFFSGGKLSETAALLLDVTDIQDDGFAYYKAQILDTTRGKDLKVIVDAGAQVGVSTRGYGPSIENQEYPGVDGKHSVIQPGFCLENIDFVEGPSVQATEDNMAIESKTKRSVDMPKTLDELKQEFPSIFEGIEKEFEAKISAVKAEAESFKTKLENTTKNFDSLVDLIKTVKPEAFTPVAESEVIASKDAEIKKIADELTASKASYEEMKSKVDAVEVEKIKAEKDREIESIKAADPEYASLECAMKKFEACINAKEVRQVYEANKSFIDSIKKSHVEKPATPKTDTTVKAQEDASLIAELKLVNEQRKNSGLSMMSVEEFKKLK